MVDECKESFLRFDLDYDEVLVLDRTQATTANTDILAQHGIPADRSIGPIPDDAKVWFPEALHVVLCTEVCLKESK